MTVRQNKKKPANEMCHVSVAAVQVCQKKILRDYKLEDKNIKEADSRKSMQQLIVHIEYEFFLNCFQS